MEVVYGYSSNNKFPHKFEFIGASDKQREEIYRWLKNSGGKYQVDFCYWSVAEMPYWEDQYPRVHFIENDIALAFKLEWV